MKMLLIGLLVLGSISAIAKISSFEIGNDLRVIARKVINNRLPDKIPAWKAQNIDDSKSSFSVLRFERNGVIDFVFKTEDGKHVGNAYCLVSELIRYKEGFTKDSIACFRINIHELKKSGLNNIGKQVGIY